MFEDYKERRKQKKENRELIQQRARLVSLNKDRIDNTAYEIYKYACEVYDKFQEEYRCDLVRELEGIIKSKEKQTPEIETLYLAKLAKLDFIYGMFDDAMTELENIIDIEDFFCINEDKLQERQEQYEDLIKMSNNLDKYNDIFIKANEVFLASLVNPRNAMSEKMNKLRQDLKIFNLEIDDQKGRD